MKKRMNRNLLKLSFLILVVVLIVFVGCKSKSQREIENAQNMYYQNSKLSVLFNNISNNVSWEYCEGVTGETFVEVTGTFNKPKKVISEARIYEENHRTKGSYPFVYKICGYSTLALQDTSSFEGSVSFLVQLIKDVSSNTYQPGYAGYSLIINGETSEHALSFDKLIQIMKNSL